MKIQTLSTPQHDGVKTGVLLINLGTPSAPTSSAVRRYLAEFLSDPRVVEIPRVLWKCILHGIILRIRPRKTARLYQKIWQAQGSPLLVNSQAITDKLQQQLNAHAENIQVVLGMRYGTPSVRSALETLRKSGISNLICLPMYPQYAASTTGTAFDAVSRALQTWRWVPKLQFINHYADAPEYIDALAQHITAHWARHPRGQLLLFSFHGLPKRCLTQGDPYYCYCQKTVRLVAEKLGLVETQYKVVFQSRFGRETWLQPYCDETLKNLPNEGIDSVDIICPGFAADCLETLEEISITNREIFLNAGGKQYHYIPALNAADEHIVLYQRLVIQQ